MCDAGFQLFPLRPPPARPPHHLSWFIFFLHLRVTDGARSRGGGKNALCAVVTCGEAAGGPREARVFVVGIVSAAAAGVVGVVGDRIMLCV